MRDSESNTSGIELQSSDARPHGEKATGVPPALLAAAARVMAHVLAKSSQATASVSSGGESGPDNG